MLTVFVDPAVAPLDKQKELISKACADVGVLCDFVPQRVEKTLCWHPGPNTPPAACEDIHKEVMAVLYASEAVEFIKMYVEQKQGCPTDGMTLTEWVMSLQSSLGNKNLSVFIVGLSKLFSNQKAKLKRQDREAVSHQPKKPRNKKGAGSSQITKLQAEEAIVDVQLVTGCVAQLVETDEELSHQIKLFTKAVADKPYKKGRFDSVFSFLEEGASGLYVNKQGQGLSKVWKHQLMQFKNFGAEMADAVLGAYPSPWLLYEACKNGKETEKSISEINVRRHASVVATNRKIGKEHARRIVTLVTSTDPDQVIK